MDVFEIIVPVSVENGVYTACSSSLIAHYAGRSVTKEEVVKATAPVAQKVGYLIGTYGNEEVYGEANYIAQLYAEQFRVNELRELWREDMLLVS